MMNRKGSRCARVYNEALNGGKTEGVSKEGKKGKMQEINESNYGRGRTIDIREKRKTLSNF